MGAPPQEGSQNGQKPKDSAELRDGRRPEDLKPGDRDTEGQRPDQREGAESRREPQPGSTGTSDPDRPDDPQRADGGAWDARLPAELRDAAANGQLDRVPARYRHLVERYYRWLQQQKAADAGR